LAGNPAAESHTRSAGACAACGPDIFKVEQTCLKQDVKHLVPPNLYGTCDCPNDWYGARPLACSRPPVPTGEPQRHIATICAHPKAGEKTAFSLSGLRLIPWRGPPGNGLPPYRRHGKGDTCPAPWQAVALRSLGGEERRLLLHWMMLSWLVWRPHYMVLLDLSALAARCREHS